jgi:nucleoside-diphosphate-sugar epimerase
MRSLVTGATGFTGSHLVRHLLASGDQVRALVRPVSRVAAQALGPIEIAEGDLRDAAAVDAAMPGVDRVFHLGALFREARHGEQAYFDVNITGTENVLEAARRHGVARVVYCSTSGVYGSVRNPPADETTPPAPGDAYQQSKLEAERRALAFGRDHGLAVSVIRPAMIWGEGDRRLLKLFRSVVRRRFVMLGDGSTMFHFVHVDDVCRGFLLAAGRERACGETYLIAGAGPIRLSEVVGKIARANGVPAPRLRIPFAPVLAVAKVVESVCVPLGIEPPIYPRRVKFFVSCRWFSIDKARRELGYEPAMTVDEEIDRISSWYRENGWYD